MGRSSSIRQAAFSSGELAPQYWGRTDIPRYGTGLRRLKDFFPSKQGSVVSRPGTQYLGHASDATIDIGPISGPADLVTVGAVVRLIPFKWSDTDTTQNSVIIFGQKKYEVWTGGLKVTNLGDPSSPFVAADLHKLQYAQSGDQLFLACAGYAPCILTRHASDDWTIDNIDFSRVQPAGLVPKLDESSVTISDANHPVRAWAWVVTAITKDDRGALSESAPVSVAGQFFTFGKPWLSPVVYQQNTIVVDPGSPTNFYQSLHSGNQNHQLNQAAWWIAAQGADEASLWGPSISYPQGFIVERGVATGNFYVSLNNGNIGNAPESSPAFWLATTMPSEQDDAFSTTSNPLFPDRMLTLRLYTGTFTPPLGPLVCFRVYRGLASPNAGQIGMFGWVGDTSSSTFTDDGSEPDYTISPPQGINPFKILKPDGTVDHTETPISVTFFEDRLVFGGAVNPSGVTIGRPTWIFASAVGDYFNFDQRLVPVADESIIYALASRKRELIRSVVGLDKLMALTNSSLYQTGGSNGPLAPNSIEAHVNVDIGSDWVAPLVVEGAFLWVRDKGTGVRRVAFDLQRSSYVSQDLSMFSEHLVLGYSIKDWCYAEDPWGLVWAVRSDGLLLSLTFDPDDGLWGWAQHGICAADDGTPGVVQSVCTIPEGDEDVVYLAVTGGTPRAWDSGTTYAIDDLVVSGIFIFAAIEPNTNHAPDAGGGDNTWWRRVLEPPAWILRMGTRLEILPYKFPTCLDAWTDYGGVVFSGFGTHEFDGLGYLEGRSVYFVMDGTPFGPYVVDNGSVFIANPHPPGFTSFTSVRAGLLYQPELELLDLPEGRTRRKVVNEVSFEVKVTGVLHAGETLSKPLQPTRFVAASTTPPTGQSDLPQSVRVQIAGSWNSGGRACLRQQQPLPVTVLGVTREVTSAD